MTKQAHHKEPSDPVTLERAFSLANEAMWTVALQRRRVRSAEPEDNVFASRWWVDIQFFILSLRRLRLAAKLACRVSTAAPALSAALKNFDGALPSLMTMRNVSEHIDEYSVDRGREKLIDRRMLQVGAWDGTTYEWLGKSLNVDIAHDAAHGLYSAIREALSGHT